MAYLDLNTIHNPSPLTAPPAGWGDQVRDNDEALRTGLTWPMTAWTPVFKAATFPIAATVNYAKYRRIGDWVEGAFVVTLTATAAGGGVALAVTGAPAPHADISAIARFPLGAGRYRRTGPQEFSGITVWDTVAGGIALMLGGGNDGLYLGASGSGITATSGDVFACSFAYPAA